MPTGVVHDNPPEEEEDPMNGHGVRTVLLLEPEESDSINWGSEKYTNNLFIVPGKYAKFCPHQDNPKFSFIGVDEKNIEIIEGERWITEDKINANEEIDKKQLKRYLIREINKDIRDLIRAISILLKLPNGNTKDIIKLSNDQSIDLSVGHLKELLTSLYGDEFTVEGN